MKRRGGERDVIKRGTAGFGSVVLEVCRGGGGKRRGLCGGGDDDGTGGENFPVGVLLGHGKGVLTRWDVDTEGNGELRGGLYGLIEAGVFAFIAARPHPVGREGDAGEAFGEGSKDEVREGFGDGQHGTGGSIQEGGLRSVSDGGSQTGFSREVEGYGAVIA